MFKQLLDRREFLKDVSKTSLAALLASAVPMGVVFAEGHGKGSAKFEVIEGYNLDPANIHEPKDLKKMSEFEAIHVPTLKMPLVAEDGSVVPFYVVSNHPMTKDHYIESVEILNFNDPIVHKGKISLSPANGEVYFSSQLRAVSGTNIILAVMKCNKHGRWVGKATVKVTVGGC